MHHIRVCVCVSHVGDMFSRQWKIICSSRDVVFQHPCGCVIMYATMWMHHIIFISIQAMIAVEPNNIHIADLKNVLGVYHLLVPVLNCR